MHFCLFRHKFWLFLRWKQIFSANFHWMSVDTFDDVDQAVTLHNLVDSEVEK